MNFLADVEFHPVRIPMKMRFRRVTWREAVLVEGRYGWGEFSPFPEYPPEVTATWLASALAAAVQPWPVPTRSSIVVNTTVPAVEPDIAATMVTQSGCNTAKVKVAEPGQTFADDLARVAAVRAALGSNGHLRVDANGAWTVAEAIERVKQLAEFDLEYVEQPVTSIEELEALRPHIEVKVAGDEVIRHAVDPMKAISRGVVDILVLKVQPMGGMDRLLELANRAGLPVVVSSALDTSVGLSAGLYAAASLPDLPYACGLGTASLLEGDVVAEPLTPVNGAIELRRPEPTEELLLRWKADAETEARLTRRLRQAAELLT